MVFVVDPSGKQFVQKSRVQMLYAKPKTIMSRSLSHLASSIRTHESEVFAEIDARVAMMRKNAGHNTGKAAEQGHQFKAAFN